MVSRTTSDVGFRADLARYYGETFAQQRLDRRPAVRVARKAGVKKRVGDLVGKLVGVPLANALRRVESYLAHCDDCTDPSNLDVDNRAYAHSIYPLDVRDARS